MKHAAAMLFAPLACLMLTGCGGGGGSQSAAPPVSLPSPAPTPTPAPTPAPTPTPPPTPGLIAMPAVTAAVNASSVADIYVIVGTRTGIVYRYQKGGMAPTNSVAIASASKLLTSLMIQRLVERGTLRLDDHPQRYLTYWTNDPADRRSAVTLDQLLSMTSGFNSDTLGGNCITNAATTVQACARAMYDSGPNSTPGSSFSYGGAAYQIAAAMAEAATGRNMSQLVNDELVQPFGLTGTSFTYPSTANPLMAGGGFSNIEDFAKIMAAVLDGRLAPNRTDYIRDRTAGLPVLYDPRAGDASGNWHYALGSWRECDAVPFSATCASQQLVSSPGLYGWTPWVDYDRGYWAVIGIQTSLFGDVASVRLEQQIQPLINSALGLP